MVKVNGKKGQSLAKAAALFLFIFLTLWQSPSYAEADESPSLSQVGRPLLAWLEKSIPLFVETSAKQLARCIKGIGERGMARVCTEKEFRQIVLGNIQARFPREIRNLVAEIQPDGIVGSGIVRVGRWNLRVASRVGIKLVEEELKAQIHEAKVEAMPVPRYVLRMLERRVNRAIAQQASHLKVKQIQLREGSAFVSVELT